MPSGDTFSIPPIAALLDRLPLGDCIVDPFARNSMRAHWRNDLSPDTPAEFHLHAEAFVDLLAAKGVRPSAILFDPPYSYRQCRELYQAVGAEWLRDDQQQVGRWQRLKDKLTELCALDAVVVSFGWNSTGFGKTRGWRPIEYLLVNHGSAHNDTIVTVERR